MTATYDPIATTTLGSAASTITFSSIPNTFTDLRLVFVGRHNSAANNLWVRFNNDSGTNYSRIALVGSGTAAESFQEINQSRIILDSLSTTIPLFVGLDIFSYLSNVNKTCLIEYNADRNGSGNVIRNVALWRNTSAITQINILNSSGDFAAGTTATLYGIKAE